MIFFTQYERDIDKFKPAVSGFVTGLYRDKYEEQLNDETEVRKVEKWYMFEIQGVLDFMKKHPIKAYAYSGRQIQYIYEEMSGITCLKEYIVDWFHYKYYRRKDKKQFKEQLKIAYKLVNKLTQYHYYIEVRPENYSPRVEVIVRRKAHFDYNKCVIEENIMKRFDEKHYNKVRLTQYDYDLDYKIISKEDLDEDSDLYKSFKVRLANLLNDDEFEVEKCNCKHLLLDIDNYKE